jgi:chemotaxis protein MotB
MRDAEGIPSSTHAGPGRNRCCFGSRLRRTPASSTAAPAAPAKAYGWTTGTYTHLQGQIEQALRQMPEFAAIRKNVVLSVTGEGLRIDLLETEQGLFFVSGNPTPTAAGERLLQALAGQLAKMPNDLIIEGHTDAQPFRNSPRGAHYGNWELAADRANAARRLLLLDGVPALRVAEIRGFADRQLLNRADPNDPRNRRVSLVVRLDNPVDSKPN